MNHLIGSMFVSASLLPAPCRPAWSCLNRSNEVKKDEATSGDKAAESVDVAAQHHELVCLDLGVNADVCVCMGGCVRKCVCMSMYMCV